VIPLRLPLLEPHRAALETCTYCPKLSRAACPVSNVEHSETVTPWGKMSLAYFSARGDLPVDEEHAAPSWACSACYACRERCDHRTEVAAALTDARAEMFARGAAPAAAREVAARFGARSEEVARAVDAIPVEKADPGAPALLVGCGYARHAPDVASDAVRAVAAISGRPHRLLRACCGLPLLHAGDRAGFLDAAHRFVAETRGAPRVVAVDPGCARALLVEYPRLGVTAPPVDVFVDLAARALHRLQPAPPSAPYRWHDPCQLGRGLGRYDEPRAVLTRIAGRAPQEFQRRRGEAECSGGGGLLSPSTGSRAAASS
jgi:Fe-S oxidoreductase